MRPDGSTAADRPPAGPSDHDPEDVEAALEAAARAARRCDRTGHVGKGPRPKPPAAVLEEELGPLDWSFDGDGFRLLRELLAREG